jgi:serine/threonine-protein kinase
VSDFQSRLQRALDADFLIERELGGAGMSRVFVATERALQRKVVIKVLPPELAAGVNVERFRREIQLAAQLQHPHIVPLLAAGDDEGLLWFSMPYIEGESLRGVLQRQERLPSRDVVRILHDVVDALAYAHARGVVHRDIKPDNILTSGMHALVTDFGVAKALSAAIPVHGGTTTGMAIGTPAYMAPEQLAADPAADHRVDLYGVGLLAYELLTGAGPFSGASPQATLAAQLTQMPEPPHRTVSDIPEPLSALIMHCLAKDANKRPASARALLTELEALPAMSSGAALPVRRAKRPWALMGVGMAAAAAIAFAMWRPFSAAATAADAESLRARDANRTGGAPSMEVARTGTRRESATLAETIPVFREVTDGAQTTTVPLVITRAESLAIAEAVRRRQTSDPIRRHTDSVTPTPAQAAPMLATGASASPAPAAAPAGPVMPGATSGALSSATSGPATRIIVRTGDGNTASIDRDALLAEVGRIFADSMSHALRQMDVALTRNIPRMVQIEPGRQLHGFTPLMAPPTDGRLRIVVTDYNNTTGRRELGGITRDVARQLRESIGSERFDVVNADFTERAARTSPDRMAVGWALRADYVVSGIITMRGDSAVLLTLLTDVRGGRYSRAFETAAPVSDLRRTIEPAQRQVSAWLDSAAIMTQQRRGPRGEAEVRR